MDMDRSEELILVSETKSQNDKGVWEVTTSERLVFCQVNSVTRSEFFEGGRNGLNPEFKFTMFGADYNGEPIVEYNGLEYAVYRTYLTRNDMIELYVERKGGTNGAGVTPVTPTITT